MALRDVLFVSENCDVSPDEAVGDSSTAVDVGAFHDDGVLDLCVADGCVVSDAGVGADVGVGAYVAVVSYDKGSSEGGPSADEGAPVYGQRCSLFREG